MRGLVRLVEEWQREEGVSDAVVAAWMGVSQPTWTRIRNGRRVRGYGVWLVIATLRRYPGRWHLIVNALLADSDSLEPV